MADLGGVEVSTITEAPLADAELLVVAVPSQEFGGVVASLPGSSPVLSLTKGLDPATGERLSTLVRDRPIAVLSGPNIAGEIARGLPAAAVVSSEEPGLAETLQREIISPMFRVYVNDDLVGVELCAAAKNVIALAAGGADGLSLGDNAKAGLVTRGVAEMRRLADAAGAKPDTFAGLTGMGDLIVTCWSPSGRNRRAGELIAQGASVAEAVAQIGHVSRDLPRRPSCATWATASVWRCRSQKACARCSAARRSRPWSRAMSRAMDGPGGSAGSSSGQGENTLAHPSGLPSRDEGMASRVPGRSRIQAMSRGDLSVPFLLSGSAPASRSRRIRSARRPGMQHLLSQWRVPVEIAFVDRCARLNEDSRDLHMPLLAGHVQRRELRIVRGFTSSPSASSRTTSLARPSTARSRARGVPRISTRLIEVAHCDDSSSDDRSRLGQSGALARSGTDGSTGYRCSWTSPADPVPVLQHL